MSKRKITMTVSTEAKGEWDEDYEIDSYISYEKWAKEVIEDFNNSLRDGEYERTLISVEDKGVIYDDEDDEGDDW